MEEENDYSRSNQDNIIINDDRDDEETVSNLMEAIPIVIKKSLMHNGVVRGLHKVARALASRHVECCFLAKTATEDYASLIQALCREKKVPLIEVPDLKLLGKWAGLCTIDKEGEPRKIVGATSVVITDFGEESPARNFILQHISSMRATES